MTEWGVGLRIAYIIAIYYIIALITHFTSSEFIPKNSNNSIVFMLIGSVIGGFDHLSPKINQFGNKKLKL